MHVEEYSTCTCVTTKFYAYSTACIHNSNTRCCKTDTYCAILLQVWTIHKVPNFLLLINYNDSYNDSLIQADEKLSVTTVMQTR